MTFRIAKKVFLKQDVDNNCDTFEGTLFIGLIGFIIFVLSQNAIAEDDMTGREEFRSSCAVCHGISGQGDGSLSTLLKIQPADLTRLSINNAGKFPTMAVSRIIDGRQNITGHGDRDMPIWGIRYAMEAEEKYGRSGREEAIRSRILQLVDYLEGIQKH